MLNFLIKIVNMDPNMESPLKAALLRPIDDVATALGDLARGSMMRLTSGAVAREVTLVDDIRTGHKFAVRALAGDLRIRKYGEYIGRTTRPIAAGEWVHDHNLATAAHQTRQAPAGGPAAHEIVEDARVLRVFGNARCAVGENPCYDAARQRFYGIDVRERPAIYRLDLTTGEEQLWPLGEDIGSIALADGASGGDTLLACLRSGFAWFDCATGTLRPIHDPEPDTPQTRLNDGKCDARGRYWCGSMNPESGTADGGLYVLHPDLHCVKVLSDLVVPNGVTWSLDNRTMYLADTRRGVIWAFDFDLETGALDNRCVFADYASMPGGPDGATLDSGGFLWSAQVDGGCRNADFLAGPWHNVRHDRLRTRPGRRGCEAPVRHAGRPRDASECRGDAGARSGAGHREEIRRCDFRDRQAGARDLAAGRARRCIADGR